ncbi:hypothetical protein SUGI_0070340 [Cryptomeria japonica]|nr:hypothetical protein SUGI_0070340 [Cryptomeria japonica]
MASLPRLTAGSNAEQVECRDELITQILSRVSTRDVLKMTTVIQRWRTLIFDPYFAHTHYKNCHPESMFFFNDLKPVRRTMPERFQLRFSNPQTVDSIDAQDPKEPIDVEELFRDDDDLLYMILGYDVNQDQWSFSIFLPASVGFPYCLTEWEGNLLVCASNSTHDENQFALAASSSHGSNRRIRYSKREGDGHFVFWKLDTEHKLWTRERELDLSHRGVVDLDDDREAVKISILFFSHQYK